MKHQHTTPRQSMKLSQRKSPHAQLRKAMAKVHPKTLCLVAGVKN
jgi:hypothetical protein